MLIHISAQIGQNQTAALLNVRLQMRSGFRLQKIQHRSHSYRVSGKIRKRRNHVSFHTDLQQARKLIQAGLLILLGFFGKAGHIRDRPAVAPVKQHRRLCRYRASGYRRQLL